MEQLTSTFEGFKNLAARVIQSAFEDLRTDIEIKVISLKLGEYLLIEGLSKKEKAQKEKLNREILDNKNARVFFVNGDYSLWADTLNMDYGVIDQTYNKIIRGLKKVEKIKRR